MAKATTKRPAEKPAKPYPEFPLFPHPSGRWCKKIRQRFHYFGPWSDPDGALDRYLTVKDDLHAGRTPRPKGDAGGLRLCDLCNTFLDAKDLKLRSGELHGRTFGEYRATSERLTAAFNRERLVSDLLADDFAKYRAQLAERLGPVALSNEIQRVRSLFKFGYENGLIANPVRFGTEFVKPSRRTIRVAKSNQPQRTLTPVEIRKLIKLAPVQLRAMILLGINCGYGNTDVASLPVGAVDLKRGVIDFPRPKTGVPRRAMLWPETVKALKDARKFEDDRAARRAERAGNGAAAPATVEDPAARLFFTTRFGKPWAQSGENKRDSAVGKEFAKLLDACGINRPGVSFYALRHTFATVAGGTRDVAGVNRVMGHHDPSIGAVYREWLKDDREDARLKAIADHVRAWLFPRGGKKVKSKNG